MPPFDLNETDRLLSTTRAVRKRLDFDRPVERGVILDCIRLAQQAPTGSNSQGWRWVIVTDQAKKDRLAEMYRRGGGDYLATAAKNLPADDAQTARVLDSASYLAQNLERVPVLVIPCIKGRPPEGTPMPMVAGHMGSIFPAVWSFQLALRSRGLGSVITSFHLMAEKEAAELLGIPDNVLQVALLPVAYTKGTDFKPAARPPVERIVHWDSWGNKTPEG
ncbi:MAG TPA: nitroreductase family protein [Acidimicrobiales bacterium]|nr:nitroreductase family protein [Acidimicrobiales bacterium]